MNNDNITAQFVVGCSPVSALPNNNAAAAAAIAAAGVALNGNNDTDSPFTSIAGHSTTTISTTSPSIYTSASAPKLAVAPTSGPTDDKTKKSETWEQTKLNRLDDNGFKHLLDEVVSYKNPRDKENTSDIYRKLLQETNKKQKAQKQASRALTTRYPTRNSASNSHKQGGSLQDLVESVRNESLDIDYSSGGPRHRRHNHNSRPKKYSSVSSRQREGGSLPSNVNVSNCNLSVYEQPFMNEEKSKQRWCKNEQPRLVSNTTANTPTCLASTGGGTLPVTASTGSSIGTGVNDTTTAPVCSRVPAEISITTHACTAPHKNNLGIGSGCGRPEGSLINPITLQATINGARSSATYAALASATAIVSENAGPIEEMTENCIDSRNDLISQGFQFGRIEGIEMKIPRANIIGSVLTRSDFSPNNNNSNNTTCYVDEAVHFTTLDRGKRSVDARYIPLDENYKACKSVLGEKSELVKMQSIATKPISKQFDENENTLNTTYTTSQSQAKAKKKKTQSERNTKTLDVQSVEGYRGSDPIEELVKYIESSKDTKQNDKVAKFADTNNKKKDKKKERDRDREKEKTKIKRSNSLEELRSCSKLDGDDVTMRNKNSVKTKHLENKDKQTVMSGNTGTNRKNERRSWGTEELTYLGENNAIEEVREKVKDKEKKKSKEKDIDFNEKLDKVVEKRKKSESNLVVSIESIPCESAEFHIVTKKKKPKKQRQPAEEGRNNGSEKTQKNAIYQNRKYHTNFSNDREAYITTFNNNNGNDKSRRKSTSSMPPSEKSDSSDLDSVHSLPIESAGKRSPHQVHHHHQNQPRSYAEIARKTEAKGAVVSSSGGAAGITDSTASSTSSNNSSHTELEINPTAVPQVNTAAKKSKKSIKTDFPELISNDGGAGAGGTSCSSSTSAIVKQISYSQSLTSASKTDETATTVADSLPLKVTSMDFVKTVEKQSPPPPQSQSQPQLQQMPLQKSKSVETDGFYNSIDQYPALEKTVKRHNTTIAVGADMTIVTIAPTSGLVSAPINSINTQMENPASLSKKSKAITKANGEVLVEQQQLQQQQQHQHQQQQYPTSRKKKEKTSENFVPFTQSTSFAASNNINSKTQINHNLHIYSYNNNNHKSSYSNSRNTSNSSIKFSNRPAVIILNDDTTAGGLSSCIGNEFTFGDFNEEELRLFDDSQPQQQQQQPPQQPSLPEASQKRCSTTVLSSFDDSGGNFNTTSGSTSSDVANNSDDTMLLIHHTSSPNSSLIIDQSSDSGICSNYDGTKVKRISSNQQNTGISTATNRCSTAAKNVVRNNAINSSASTSPFKESLSSASSSSSSSSSSASSASSSSSTYVANVPVSISTTPSANANKTSKSNTTSTSSSQQQHIQLDSTKAKAATPNSNRLSTINKRNNQQQTIPNHCISASLPSQQLETCDDIETAIIAAAKKAAAVATEQTTTSVTNKNNTKSSNNIPPMGSTIKETTINNNNTNQYNSYSFRQGVTSPPSTTTTLHSKTKEYTRRGGAAADAGVMGQQQRKEIDVHFIPPTLTTPISSIQNNETIINFIGSAWEEVANSKVTLFYDGQ